MAQAMRKEQKPWINRWGGKQNLCGDVETDPEHKKKSDVKNKYPKVLPQLHFKRFKPESNSRSVEGVQSNITFDGSAGYTYLSHGWPSQISEDIQYKGGFHKQEVAIFGSNNIPAVGRMQKLRLEQFTPSRPLHLQQ